MKKKYIYILFLALVITTNIFSMEYKLKKIDSGLENALLINSFKNVRKRRCYENNFPKITRKKAISLKIITTRTKKGSKRCNTDSLSPTRINIKLPPICPLKQRKRLSSIPTLSKTLSTNSLLDHIKKQNKIHHLKKTSKIDFKIFEGTKKRIIYGINGTIILYDLRGFTHFCNQTKNLILPTNFMADLSEKLDEIIYKWDGEVISRTGDGFVAIFPKTKHEYNYKKCLNKAYKSSIELGYITNKFLLKKKLKCKPEKFGIGIEIGTTLIFKNKKFSKLTPISPVAGSINNAQRYEQHSKQLLVKWKDYKPITMPEKLYDTLPKKIQQTFKTQVWYLKKQKDYYKQQLNQQGITEKMFVCSAPFKKIKEFYLKNIHQFTKKERQLKSRLHDILEL